MLDTFRTLLAKFIFKHLNRPRTLVTRAWFWLAAEAEDLDDVGYESEPPASALSS